MICATVSSANDDVIEAFLHVLIHKNGSKASINKWMLFLLYVSLSVTPLLLMTYF